MDQQLLRPPLPGEPLAEAVTRRLSHELGLAAGQVDLLLPRFSYRAVMDDGIVERELCPVYRVIAASEVAPNPDEVEDVRWMPWKEFTDGVLSDRLAISPWCREQVPQLIELGVDPLAWRTADPADLPSAAR